MAQMTTKKRIEILRTIEDSNIQKYIAMMDAATDKRTMRQIDHDKFELIPNLRDMRETNGIDVYWTICDLRDQKERELNKLEREAKAALKQEKETKKAEEKAQHHAKLTRYMNLPELKSILDDLGAQFYTETVDEITDNYNKKIAAYFTDGKFNKERPSSKDYYSSLAFNAIQQEMSPFMVRGDLKSNWEAIVKKIATESAQIWVDEFKAKMALKLGSIIDFKGGAEVKRHGNVAEYVLRLSFKDGSAFIIRTKRVWARSCNNVHFVRFPSTFHDVRFADGSKMTTPSAEKMQKEFGINIKEKEEK